MAIRLIPKRLVGQTIRAVRGRLGQTPAQFAETVGVADGAVVEAWEDGSAQPDAGTLAKIAAMGLVDVLVFHDDTPANELPQLTPGEASELRAILSRMEALLAEARQIAEAAADRTAVELLEAAAGHAPTPAAEAEAVTLAAEVTVKPRARRAAADSSPGGAAKGKSSGGRKRGSSSRGDARSAPRSRSSKSKPSSGSSSGGATSSTSDTGSGGSKKSSGSKTSGGSRSRSGSKSGGGSSGGGGSE